MKILLRPRLCSEKLGRRLARDATLAQALGAKPNGPHDILFHKFFDASGPLLPQVLAHAQAVGERMDFLRDLQFSAAEVAGASHLEVVCRKTVAQGEAESRTTLDEYQREPLQPGPARWPLRLPQHVYLSKSVPPEAIAHVDQYTGEHVLGTAAAQALRASALTGWQLQPVLHWKTRKPLPEVGEHLTTAALLPPVAPSPTVYETWDDGPQAPGTPRRYGLLAYAAADLASTPDFARTAEPWGDWSTPEWIVRQRVRAWYEAAALKGWAFRPVAVTGSALHREHEEKWAQLRETLDAVGATLFA